MIELLRAQADCTASVLKDAYGMVAKLYGRMKGNIQRTKSSESSLFINRMCCSSSDEDPFSCSAARSPYALLTRDDICKMFQGDNLALDIAINLLITVSQNIVVTLAEHKNGDTKFYSEALELVMGSCKILLRLNSTNPTRQSSHVSLLSLVEVIPVEDTIILPKIAVLDPLIYEIATQEEREGKRKQMEKWKGKGKLKPKGSGGRRREQHGISHQFDEYQMNDDSDEEEEEGGVEDNFYIRDFTVVFPILSGLALRLLHGPTQNNEMLTKVGVLCSTFLTLTRKHGDALHIIRALHLQSIFCSRVNQVREALALCEEVTELYVFEQHSAGLNKIYGGDRGLAAIASSTVGYDCASCLSL